jgi:hypothetical protein
MLSEVGFLPPINKSLKTIIIFKFYEATGFVK